MSSAPSGSITESMAGAQPQAVWFGPRWRPLFGWLHVPRQKLGRGGVVLCPPIGKELTETQYVYRLLARRLQAAGFVVLRFDYDGTGDSAGGTNDPDRIDAWLRSIDEGLDFVRRCGPSWTAAVGLRVGATLAAVAAQRSPLDALVLWDPVLSGRAFLREQRALQAIGVHNNDESPGETEIPGYVFSAVTSSALGDLEMPAGSAVAADQTLLLVDPARPGTARLRKRLDSPGIEWREYAEPGSVFDVGKRVFDVPTAIIRQVGEWVDGTCGASPVPVRLPAEVGRGAVTFATTETGEEVTERVMFLGSSRLFGLSVTSGNAPLPGAPTILMVTSGAESRVGPARQWVELSRRWACEGLRVVRFDLSGMGDSPTRPGRPERWIYSRDALRDIAEAAAAVSPQDPGNIVLVGLCSGAYASLVASAEVRPRAVIAINPLLTFAAFDDRASRAAAGPLTSPRISSRFVRRIGIIRQSLHGRFEWLPPVGWWLIYRLGVAHSPTRVLAPLVRARVPVLLVCGEEEAMPLTGRAKPVRRLLRSESFRFVVVPELDHALLGRTARDVVVDLVTRYVSESLTAWQSDEGRLRRRLSDANALIVLAQVVAALFGFYLSVT